MRLVRTCMALLGAGLSILTGMESAPAADSAVILMYHRFGEDAYPATNIRIDQFEAHIAELTSGPYTVLPVNEIVTALAERRDLPDRTVGITIDDAYLSVYREAFPRLKAANLPFTLFVATDAVDRKQPGYLDWDRIREIRDAGNGIGAHSASHLHMADASPETIRAEMQRSLRRLEEELGAPPRLFAWPYGEASLASWAMVREFGFASAFGQQSGAVHAASNRFQLPRFALNERYGGMDSFRLRVNALGLPVRDVLPEDPFLHGTNPPRAGFSLGGRQFPLSQLACYHSQYGTLAVKADAAGRVAIRFPGPLKSGRTRLNCTMPAGGGRWYWYGMQFLVPSP